jgi:hypothetical protein
VTFRVVACPRGVNHPLLLGTEAACQHGAEAGIESWLVDVELVRINRSLDDIFSEAIRTGHEHHVAESGFGIERKDHAACRERTIFMTATDSATLK